MSGSPFTMSPSIRIFTSIEVYVQFQDGTIKLYKDAASTEEYPPDPSFEVPRQEQCAVYFRLTSDSDPDAVFPEDPFTWLDANGDPTVQPATISYEKRTADNKAFSIKDDNMSFHVGDNELKFNLLVDDGTGTVYNFGSEVYGYDPTVVEKGEEEGM